MFRSIENALFRRGSKEFQLLLLFYCFANIGTQTLGRIFFLGYFRVHFYSINDVTQRSGRIFMCRGMFWKTGESWIQQFKQGFQLSRIERESPAWTLFLPLSRKACKISRFNEKNPAKHVKSPASVGKTLENNYLANFHRQGGMQPKKIIMIIYTYNLD